MCHNHQSQAPQSLWLSVPFVFAGAFAFLVVIPEGDLRLSLISLPPLVVIVPRVSIAAANSNTP